MRDIGKQKTPPNVMRWLGQEKEVPKMAGEGPWPRALVRSLCEFLDAVQSPAEGEFQPSDLVPFGGTCNTMAGVYRRQEFEMAKQKAFTFTVEKRALQQLKRSREARETLMERIKLKQEKQQ